MESILPKLQKTDWQSQVAVPSSIVSFKAELDRGFMDNEKRFSSLMMIKTISGVRNLVINYEFEKSHSNLREIVDEKLNFSNHKVLILKFSEKKWSICFELESTKGEV